MHTQVLNILKSKLQGPLPGISAQKSLAPLNRQLTDPQSLTPGSFKPSAVMILLYQNNNEEFQFPLIQRITYPGVHSGQIALPGGKLEAQDSGPLEAAMRECREEIGIEPEPLVLGQLSPLFIPVSGFLVYPFVSILETKEPLFRAQEREVESVFAVGIQELLDDKNLMTGTVPVQEALIKTPYFHLAGKQVWGATAMILNELKHLFRD